MGYTCIVFSDPRSTTAIQIATRTGEQSGYSAWTGNMRFAKLKVFAAQNRNSTCTFDIVDYNSNDSITNWMQPGIGVFVVHLGILRFSGVISKVDGNIVGVATAAKKMTYTLTCESDANYLQNYVTPTKNFTKHVNDTIMNIVKDVVDPYTNWYDRLATPSSYLDNTLITSYTVNAKPMLTQIQEICQTSSYKYRVRTKSTLCTSVTVSGTTVTSGSTSPDAWINATSNLGWGSHNKYIVLLIKSTTAYYHSCAAAVTATASGNFTMTSTNAINYSQIVTGCDVLLIQHPIIEVQRVFSRATSKVYYVSPSSSIYETLCWDFNPYDDKNDVITNVVCNFVDEFGRDMSLSMPAAFMYDASTQHFLLTTGGLRSYLTTAYDSPNTVAVSDISGTNKVQTYQDMGYPAWGVGDYCSIVKFSTPTTKENFLCATGTPTDAGDTVNGHKTYYLIKSSSLANTTYQPGDLITYGTNTSTRSVLYVLNGSSVTAGRYYWLGCELVYVWSQSGSLVVDRAMSMTSAKGYTIQTKPIVHRVGCPFFPAGDGSTTRYLGIDDYYDGSGTYDSPMKAYGLNTKTITVNKATDAGTIEILMYNVVRSLCRPKEKGEMTCLIDSMTAVSPAGRPLIPGDQFQVNFFGTVHPGASTYYEMMSQDYDFDNGSCTIKFDEFDINLFTTLSQLGLNITIT